MKTDYLIRLDILAKHYVGIGKDENILIAAAKEYGT